MLPRASKEALETRMVGTVRAQKDHDQTQACGFPLKSLMDFGVSPGPRNTGEASLCSVCVSENRIIVWKIGEAQFQTFLTTVSMTICSVFHPEQKVSKIDKLGGKCKKKLAKTDIWGLLCVRHCSKHLTK